MIDLGVMTLITIVCIAVVQDFSAMRIKNELIFIGLIAGMIFRIWGEGISASISVVRNILFPIIVLYLLFAARILGAGDIKLFSVIGSFLEFKDLAKCVLYSFIVGAVISFILLLRSKRLMGGTNSAISYFVRVAKGERVPYQTEVKNAGNLMHFSVAIGIALLLVLVKNA